MNARENGMANHGSGRPRSERVPHEKRPQHYGMSHVIYRLKPGMESLRRPKVLRVLEGAFRAAKRKGGFRLIAYSLQDTHIHMIVEGRRGGGVAWDAGARGAADEAAEPGVG
jgi:hypothetical protein